MALRNRNGGSQTPDCWLKSARNTHLTLYTRDMTVIRLQQSLILMLILSVLKEIFCAHKGISLTSWTTIIGFLVREDMEISRKASSIKGWLNPT